MISSMLKYFDNTFFKFFFGFLGIVFVSLALLAVTHYFDGKANAQRIEVEDTIAQGDLVNQ